MNIYEAMGNVYRALVHRCGCSSDFASAMLDAVCEMRGRQARELALMDLADSYGVTDVLNTRHTMVKVPVWAERVTS